MANLHGWNPRRLLRWHRGVYSRLCASVTLTAAFLCCDTPGIRLVDPEAVSDSSTGVTFHVTLEDSALAAALGWEDGVPNAPISYYRIMEGTPIQTAEADSDGTLRLPDLLPGQYRFAAYRLLQAEEAGATGGQTRAFGDGLVVKVDSPQVVELTLRADRAGSIVISELRGGGRYEGPDYGWPDYDYFGYFELYNNGDTTVFLDGMLWGSGFTIHTDGGYSCVMTSPYRNDTLGLWARYFHQFPGSGTDYPLAPGQAAVIALDAVDHSVAHPSLPDLTGAVFELEGTADADNPAVPNAPEVGPGHRIFETHGLDVSCMSGCFLAHAANVAGLVTERLPFFDGTDWVRIPMESVIDVVTTGIWSSSYDQFTPCATKVHRNLDRLEEPQSEVFYDVSISTQRRVLRMGPGGFPLLQDVGVSFLDFILAPRSPGWVEY
jgi:hypothetical protein